MALLELVAEGPRAATDGFLRVDDESALPPEGGVLVSLARFLAERERG